MMVSTGRQVAVLDGVRRLFGGGSVAALGSDSLLDRFARRGDESAFEAIVDRHGPMVLGVCRRLLDDPHDVDDAYQATFLVFIRKAGSIRDGEGLAPWLHGVARRVATRARTRSNRRRAVERPGLEVDPAGPAIDPALAEVRAVVDEELARLPDRYRRAIVLCDLEGVTQAEASRRLEWSEGTVRGRLAKGRGLLRDRLTRRGLVAPVGLFATLVATDSASAARSIRPLLQAATGRLESVSTSAIALSREVLALMARQHWIAVGIGTLVAGATLSGAGFILAQATSATPRQPEATSDEPFQENVVSTLLPPPIAIETLKNPPPPEPATARRIAVGDRLVVEVLEAMPGRPITGERLVRSDGTISLGFYGDLEVVGLTRRQIKVKLIEFLRQFVTDAALGLVFDDDDQNGPIRRVHPANSNRVYVDDSISFDPRNTTGKSDLPFTEKGTGGPAQQPKLEPIRLKEGDRVLIEVLEAAPGRPISGERLVRADGTVSLGFYGDVAIAGLTRREAKRKVIEHMRTWITDQALGLVVSDKSGVIRQVEPEQSTRVFVEEVEKPRMPSNQRLDALESKVDRILETLNELKRDRRR